MEPIVKYFDHENQSSKQNLKLNEKKGNLTIYRNQHLNTNGNRGLNESADFAKSKFANCTDMEIWEQFRDQDEMAFIFIYSEYYHKLVQYGWQFTRDKQLIEDCVQDLFIYLRKKRSRLGKLNTRISVYLMCSYRRLILEYKKKLEKDIIAFNQQKIEFEFSFEKEIIDEDTTLYNQKLIQNALANLPIKQREVIYYLYYQNLSYEEIRVIMKVTNIKTIRNVLYRSLSSLRSNLILRS